MILIRDARPVANRPFIISTSLDKPDATARKSIRSHVMRGKNRRKQPAKLKPGSWINREGARDKSESEDAERRLAVSLAPPRPLCSDLQTIHYREQMQPYMYCHIFKCESSLSPRIPGVHVSPMLAPRLTRWQPQSSQC